MANETDPTSPDLTPSISLAAYRELDEAGQKVLDAIFTEYELSEHPVMTITKKRGRGVNDEELFQEAKAHFDSPHEMMQFILNASDTLRRTENAIADYNRLRALVKKLGMN